MPEERDLICYTCVKENPVRLVTEAYEPIITEDGLYYIGGFFRIYELVKVDPPKPTWTDLYGNSVTQYGTVLIGGNGLNS